MLASSVYADNKEETKVNAKSTKPAKTPTVAGPPTAPPQLKNAPKSHSFVRHSRKIPQPLRPRLPRKPVPRKASPRQSVIRPRPKAPLRKAPLRKFPRKLPLLKSRQTTGTLPVRLPAFQNRPIQPIPNLPLRPAQVVPVERNPRFRRLVTNLRQSATQLRHGFQSGSSNLRNSFRTFGSRNPLSFRRPPPANQNRRKINLPPIVFKRAEDMPGYEKFTLAEVIYPEDEAKVSKNQI